MNKYIIFWDAGYGQTADIVEAENQEEADHMAYLHWKEEVEQNADYSAQPYTDELAEEHGLEEW